MRLANLKRIHRSGYHLSEQHKKNISQGNMGRVMSSKALEKSKVNLDRTGKNWTPEQRRKLLGRFRGEKSPVWKGGRTKIQLRIRQLYKYTEWRKFIFCRDNFTCTSCGIDKCYIEADHYPVKFSTLLDTYKIDTLEKALECAELWDTNNGRTLCRKCHDKTKVKQKI